MFFDTVKSELEGVIDTTKSKLSRVVDTIQSNLAFSLTSWMQTNRIFIKLSHVNNTAKPRLSRHC
jgi:hypothetical protein